MISLFKNIILFLSFFPFVSRKLLNTRSKTELIEFREWIYASKKVLNGISTSSKLSKYRKQSEQGELFDSKVLTIISKLGTKGKGVIANNVYLNGGGYRASSKIAIEKFLEYEVNCGDIGLLENNLVLLGPEWTSSIGHSTQLSILPKLGRKKSGSPNRILIYSHAANHFYVSLHAEHYSLCRVPEDLKSVLVNYLDHCLHPLDAFRSTSTEVLDLYSAITSAEREWVKHSDSSNFLKLPDKALQLGSDFLQRTGLDRFEWFVALHMREATTTPIRGAGNVEIESYIPAIKEIISLGGAVIRLGNPGMSKIEELDSNLGKDLGYFDYANSKFKSEILDIFLMSHCKFMIGTSSGPIFIPKEFGKAVLYTNAPNVGVLPGIRGFCLPNLYQDKSGKCLTLSKMLELDEVGWKMSKVGRNYIRVSNTAEDIKEATRYMALHGFSVNAESIDNAIDSRVAAIRSEYGLMSAMEICPTYLEAHSEMQN